MEKELLIKNGQVIDPANGINTKCDVLIADGNIAKVGKINESAAKGYRCFRQMCNSRAY